MNPRRKISVAAAAVLLAALIIWIAWGNTALTVTEQTVQSDRLPQAFSGFKLAQVSDLHNAEMGKGNERLLAALRQAEPDVIVITGDFIDSRHTNTEVALQFAEKVTEIAPTYYITGNHEARMDIYPDFAEQLAAPGVVLLQNESVQLQRGGDTITLIGIDDPGFVTTHAAERAAATEAALAPLMNDCDGFTVLLAHRPELIDIYAKYGADLVLSGHTHGGQVRLPFIGGIFAPDQGLFPAYDGGRCTADSTQMLVSRGIGNSLFPFRINNRPELVVAELTD